MKLPFLHRRPRPDPFQAPPWVVVHVHHGAPPKPAVGAPCNGCGLCCLSAPCPLGILASRRRSGPCVALRWDAAGPHYRCGLVTQAHQLLPGWPARGQALLAWLARRWIAAGVGCDADIQAEPPTPGAPAP